MTAHDLLKQLAEHGATVVEVGGMLTIYDPANNLDLSDLQEAGDALEDALEELTEMATRGELFVPAGRDRLAHSDRDLNVGITASRKSPGRPRGYIEDYRPQAATLALLDDVKRVLAEYEDYLPLTVRQIFYRLVGSFGYEKTENAYARLCEHVGKARRAHVIAFEAIRDDGVGVMRDDCYADADHFRRSVNEQAKRYRKDMLANQPYKLEVWCEAAGMQPQLANAVAEWSIPVYSSGGFDSLTSKYDIVQRVITERWRPTVILHLGDCDPSGEAMFRAASEDVAAFVEKDRHSNSSRAVFQRVALTPDQVARFNLPTAPAKASTHSKEWGERPTAQLEALAPNQLNTVLRAAVLEFLDQARLDEAREAEGRERIELTRLLPAPGGAR